jgi:transcription initiation factor IIF auxiliary subunit
MEEWKAILTALQMKECISVLLDPKSDEQVHEILEKVISKLHKLSKIKSQRIGWERKITDNF